MTYAALLEALFAARRFGVKLGLERMEAALARLGHPERALGAVVQVGGTNGKGSTAALIAGALVRGGHRVGLYTSPHLCRFTERIQVDGVEVARDALAERYAKVLGAGGGELTFFEQATLLGILSFAEESVEVAVLEVGLGGRLDATTAVPADVAVVTGVALDHQDVLGNDLASIAAEKGGIFRAGRPAVIGASGETEGERLLLDVARRQRASEVTTVGVDVPNRPPSGWPVGLAGSHQRQNAACALTTLGVLERATGGRVRVAMEARRAALAEVRWPGRLERLEHDGRVVWLDAAHNPQGARALRRALDEVAPGAPLVAVVGVSADKDVAGVLAPLVARAAQVICTAAPSPRALPPAEVARVVDGLPGVSGRLVTVCEDLPAALALGLSVGETLLVAGSLFVVGAARAWLTGEEVDPLTVQDPAAKK